MFLIRNIGDHKSTFSPELHTEFLKKCEEYIGKLKNEGKLISAQPIERQGAVIRCSSGDWSETPIDATKETWVGYYHILANNLDEAIEIAKSNPEFEYGTTASIEVRPVKMKEVTTGYVYPTKSV